MAIKTSKLIRHEQGAGLNKSPIIARVLTRLLWMHRPLRALVCVSAFEVHSRRTDMRDCAPVIATITLFYHLPGSQTSSGAERRFFRT